MLAGGGESLAAAHPSWLLEEDVLAFSKCSMGAGVDELMSDDVQSVYCASGGRGADVASVASQAGWCCGNMTPCQHPSAAPAHWCTSAAWGTWP